MKPKILNRKASRIYLLIVPLMVVIFGFGIGKISYTFYLPIWIINVCLMVISAWILGLHVINKKNEMRHLALGAFFLIVPWILISMFFGLGPPPETPAGWVETATEQQVRYFMLTIAGVFIAFGFSLLREKLKSEGENLYSLLGFIAIIIAIPLFTVNMLFWGFSLTELFKILVASNTENMPEWLKPIRALFGLISVVEVALTYIAIAAFAVSMKLAGWFSKTESRIYVTISLMAFLIIVLLAFFSEPFVTAGFAVSIPAIPFMMPYFMGINLLRRAGD
jgi:DMSO/TMAO reductase YedYZ heme-binding membrane subunit